MDFKKTIILGLFYFIVISGIFFISKYFVLHETEDIQELATQSVVSGLLGALILTYMIRRWTNQNK